MAKTLIIDTETTGVSKTDQVIELSYMDHAEFIQTMADQSVINKNYHLLANNVVTTLYKPTEPINPRAFEVHGIEMKSLIRCKPTCECSLPLDGLTYLIGHNVSFDIRVIQQSNPELNFGSIRQIDTMVLAKIINKHYNANFPDVKLETLRKELLGEERPTKYHRSADDVITTARVLLKLLEYIPAITTLDDLYGFIKRMK